VEDGNFITVFYEWIENSDTHFSGVFFKEVPNLSCDVVVFEDAS